MNISITFRHMDTSEAVKRYATEKLAKIQKFLRQPMIAKVTLSVDRLKHIAEARISSGGEHLEAKWSSEDMYASIDVVLGKLERQIRASKGQRKRAVAALKACAPGRRPRPRLQRRARALKTSSGRAARRARKLPQRNALRRARPDAPPDQHDLQHASLRHLELRADLDRSRWRADPREGGRAAPSVRVARARGRGRARGRRGFARRTRAAPEHGHRRRCRYPAQLARQRGAAGGGALAGSRWRRLRRHRRRERTRSSSAWSGPSVRPASTCERWLGSRVFCATSRRARSCSTRRARPRLSS